MPRAPLTGGINLAQTPNFGAIGQKFLEYTQYNRRSNPLLFKQQALKLAIELYNQTAAIAPSRAEIAADVKALGWHIPRRFPDGRLGRGVPGNWSGWSWAAQQRLIKKRGRRTKRDHLDEAAFMAQKPTLAMMQKFVIDIRSASRLYLASGWLGAVKDLGGSLKASSGIVYADRGGAIIQRPQPDHLIVTLWNRSRGIVDVDEQRGFVAAALAARIEDMDVYIRERREREAAFFRSLPMAA